MRNQDQVIKSLNEFMNSYSKHCMVIGTDIQEKHMNILAYLALLDKSFKVLLRVDSMNNGKYLLGSNIKTGVATKMNKLTIYVDSMQVKSQNNTPDEFDCILVYPIAALKGFTDNNLVDIINDRKAQKVFWISNRDNYDNEYLKYICNIKHIIEMNNDDDEVHNRIIENTIKTNTEEYDKLLVDNLSYYDIEEAIDNKYKMGGIYTSSMGQELCAGSFNEYIFGGNKSSKAFCIKVLENKENNKYVLLVKKCCK